MSSTHFESMWAGPYVGQDGITQTLFTAWDECPERFFLKVVEGLTEHETFARMAAMEWGSMWHEGEEALLKGKRPQIAISSYARKVLDRFPESSYLIRQMHDTIQAMFQHYERWWADHPINKIRKPFWAEHSFGVPYQLPDSRVLLLRGKFDAVYTMGQKYPKNYLQENKTKARINEQYIDDTLTRNWQVMTYAAALRQLYRLGEIDYPVGGVVYNVIRVPGKTTKDLAAKMKKDPGHYFKRWQREITNQDLDLFEQRMMIPKLTKLADWWDWIVANNGDRWAKDEYGTPGGGHHFEQPYGVYKKLHERLGEYHDYMHRGKPNSVTQVTSLFPEL